MRDAGWLNIDPAPRDDYDPEDYIDALNDSPDYTGPKVNPYAA
jgi:hypothetical protein